MATVHRIAAVGKLHRDLATVEDGDTPALETSQKTLAALLSERDLNAEASVLPWAPGTVRTLATTVLLPHMIAARVADRFFG